MKLYKCSFTTAKGIVERHIADGDKVKRFCKILHNRGYKCRCRVVKDLISSKEVYKYLR